MIRLHGDFSMHGQFEQPGPVAASVTEMDGGVNDGHTENVNAPSGTLDARKKT